MNQFHLPWSQCCKLRNQAVFYHSVCQEYPAYWHTLTHTSHYHILSLPHIRTVFSPHWWTLPRKVSHAPRPHENPSLPLSVWCVGFHSHRSIDKTQTHWCSARCFQTDRREMCGKLTHPVAFHIIYLLDNLPELYLRTHMTCFPLAITGRVAHPLTKVVNTESSFN